jgi:hypothetical protein
VAREVALEKRAGINVRLAGHGPAYPPVHVVVQRAESRFHDVVVIIAPCITRDGTARFAATVVQRDDDRAPRAFDGAPGITPLVGAAREIRHLAGMALRQPFVESRRGRGGSQRRDAREIETEPICLRLDALLDGRAGDF